MSDQEDSLSKREEFLQMFKRSADFAQELLGENERLRLRILDLERGGTRPNPQGPLSSEARELLNEIERLRSEKQELVQRFREIEAENQDFASRYVEIEEENNNLANLYISSYQLHSTLDFKEVLQIVLEIVINLIGAEIFSVLLLDEKTRRLEAVASEGCDVADVPAVPLGEGVVGQVAQTKENYFVREIPAEQKFDPANPLVAIPLTIKDKLIGVIVIYRLLQQKTHFANVDYELFTLLAGHAATAIFSSKLYSESERKLSTIQGFINLLSK